MCHGGECRWETNFRKTQLITANKGIVGAAKKPAPSIGGGKKVKAAEDAKKRFHQEMEKKCAREAEKAEKVMHLICWGPK